MNKSIIRKLLTITILACVFLNIPSRAYANMALPPTYYYGSSISLIFTMLLSDAVVLWLFLRTSGKFVTKKIFLIRLLAVFSFGILADIFSLILTDYLFLTIFPSTAKYHEIYLSNYTNLISLDRFYMLGTYLSNFTSSHPAYMQPFGIIFLTLTALISIAFANFLQKWIFRLSYKEAALLAIVFGIFTNPVWALYPTLTFIWIVIMLLWFVGIKKFAAKTKIC